MATSWPGVIGAVAPLPVPRASDAHSPATRSVIRSHICAGVAGRCPGRAVVNTTATHTRAVWACPGQVCATSSRNAPARSGCPGTGQPSRLGDQVLAGVGEGLDGDGGGLDLGLVRVGRPTSGPTPRSTRPGCPGRPGRRCPRGTPGTPSTGWPGCAAPRPRPTAARSPRAAGSGPAARVPGTARTSPWRPDRRASPGCTGNARGPGPTRTRSGHRPTRTRCAHRGPGPPAAAARPRSAPPTPARPPGRPGCRPGTPGPDR